MTLIENSILSLKNQEAYFFIFVFLKEQYFLSPSSLHNSNNNTENIFRKFPIPFLKKFEASESIPKITL